MEDATLILVGISVWHLAALNSLALYTGAFHKTWLVAPKEVLLSRPHKLGLLAAAAGAGTFIVSGQLGLLHYGIFLAAALLIVDSALIYKAMIAYRTH